jgi:hypothetical protein
MDLRGEPVEPRHLDLLRVRLEMLLGSHRVYSYFWITRSDLAEQFHVQYGFTGHQQIGAEPRHEPTFDLYVNGGIVPLGRLINVKIPDWS